MIRFLLDTDHLTLFDQGQVQVCQRYAQEPFGTVAVSIVSVHEALRGRLAALSRHSTGARNIQAYARLLDTIFLVHQLPVVPFDLSADGHFQSLRKLRLRVGTLDLKIAAVALAHQLTLVTRNRRDFALIPGLHLEDWSV